MFKIMLQTPTGVLEVSTDCLKSGCVELTNLLCINSLDGQIEAAAALGLALGSTAVEERLARYAQIKGYKTPIKVELAARTVKGEVCFS